NISVWWNQMSNTPIFNSTADYQRNAQASVLSIATGSLDLATGSAAPWERQDAATGLQYRTNVNFAVWLTKNTSSNLGYLTDTPTFYHTSDNGDGTAILAADCTGDTTLDLLVGTTSTAGRGTVEIWR